MPWITEEGRNVDEARDAAVAKSGRDAESLEIEVISKGAKGLFGLGGEPAVVRVRPMNEAGDVRSDFADDITPNEDTPPRKAPERPKVVDGEPEDDGAEETSDPDASDEDAAEVREEAGRLGAEIISGILERMDLKGEVKTQIDGKSVRIEIEGEEMGILIGRNGATLEALQELVRAGVQRRMKTRQPVVVDIENYWERRREGRKGQNGGGQRGGNRRGGNRRRRSGGSGNRS